MLLIEEWSSQLWTQFMQLPEAWKFATSAEMNTRTNWSHSEINRKSNSYIHIEEMNEVIYFM